MAISALRRLVVPFLVVSATIALLALSSGGSKAQWVKDSPQFQPIFDVKLCNDLDSTFSGPSELQGGSGACAPDTTASNHADITSTFTVPYGSMNYAQDLFATIGGAGTVRLAGPLGTTTPNPDGTGSPAGGLQSTITLGVGTNLCGGDPLVPQFIWWDAETDINDTEPCQPEGTNDRWSNFATDGGDAWTGQADANSLGVTKYPECTMALFDPDGDGVDTDGNPATIGDQPVQPNWRGIGLTQVSGDWQMLQNIEFAPGALAEAFLANPGTTHHPYAKLHKNLGYINIVQLNDPTTVILQPNPISDFCSELGTRGMIKGQIDTNGASPGGVVNRITGPADGGSYFAQSRTMSYRDADGDGIENNFDTCPWQSNTASEDPYTSTGPDTDMLDSVCDPAPGAKVDDEDGDAYENPQDWCPQSTNSLPGGETDAENLQDYNDGAPDGGPRQDSIGDDCDGTVSSPKENPTGLGNTNVSDGLYFNAIHTDSTCIEADGRVDNDEDGWCDDIDSLGFDVYDGLMDIDGDGDADADDDYYSLAGVDVIDGGFDVDGDGDVDGDDDGTFVTVEVIDGALDIVDNDVIDTDDDGTMGETDSDTYDSNAAEDGQANQCGDGLDDGKEDLDRTTPADGVDRWDDDCNANLGYPGQMTHTPMDSAGIVFSATLDSDGDGYDNLTEWYQTTDPSNQCPLHPKPDTDPAGPHDAWPSDMDNNGTANLLDLLPFKKAFNTEAAGGNDNEDGVASCNDGLDNGGDGQTDLADADCTGPSDTEDGETTCYNGIDDGTDGADLADPDHCYKARVDLDPKGDGTADKVNLLDLLPFKTHFNVHCTEV